jgi:hypothetical protein
LGQLNYSDADGEAEDGSQITWILNDSPLMSGSAPQIFYCSSNENALTGDGQSPVENHNIVYGPGKWGSALAVEEGGLLSYARHANINFDEGTIDMWVALRCVAIRSILCIAIERIIYFTIEPQTKITW